jgi:hypothetical protein
MKMNKIYKILSRIVFQAVILAAAASVNVTCYRRYYQEELDEQLDGLRKYRDGK